MDASRSRRSPVNQFGLLSRAFDAQCGSLCHLGIDLSSHPLSRLSNSPKASSCAHSVLRPLFHPRRFQGQRGLNPSTRSEVGPGPSSNGTFYVVRPRAQQDSKVYGRDQPASWVCLGDLQQGPVPLLRYRSGAHLHKDLEYAYRAREKRTVIEETLFQVSPFVLLHIHLCLFNLWLFRLFMRVEDTRDHR